MVLIVVGEIRVNFTEINGRLSAISEVEGQEILADFLDSWRYPCEIRGDLLPEIDAVLEGRLPDIEIGADVVGLAYVDPVTTKLIGSDVGHENMVFKTSDFKKVILEWLKFLEDKKGGIS